MIFNLFKSKPKEANSKQTNLFLIDPPRSGFKNIKDWTDFYQPKYVIYISCFAATQMRDIKTILENYKLEKVQLIDLFPSTHHFETLLLLQRK